MGSSGFDFDRLVPSGPDYALRPIAEAVDWSAAAGPAAEGAWYLVVFRSIRRADADDIQLDVYDARAHAEAAEVPGFAHYFKGPLTPERACLSFCLWASRHDARAASGLPAHREAVSIIGAAYEQYSLEFYTVRKVAGSMRWEFEAYDRAPAGDGEVRPAA